MHSKGKYYLTIIIGSVLLLTQQCVSATPNDSIFNLFYKQLSAFPQEKIYAHVDKKDYMVGEDVWMRIYLLDAQTHFQDVTSRYVYVELINPENEVVERKKIKLNEKGIFYGHIPIVEDLPTGTYHLRFYTKYMTNLSEDFFYTREINVINSQYLSHNIETSFEYSSDNKKLDVTLKFVKLYDSDFVLPEKITINPEKKLPRKIDVDIAGIANFSLNMSSLPTKAFLVEYEYNGIKDIRYIHIPPPENEYDVSFFPEGGNIPMGGYSQIAFKAINSQGFSEEISGTIVNQKGDTINRFASEHRGMGMFFHTAQEGETYYAVCRNKNNIEKKFELPAPLKNTLSLQVFRQKKNVIINISKSSDKTTPDSLNLILLSRGVAVYSSPWDNSTGVVRIPEEILPTGIIQILITDNHFTPITERLVFNIDRNKLPNVTLNNAGKQYSKREKVNLGIDIMDFNNNPLIADLSVSIVDNDIANIDTTSNILSTILLSSDLRGHIENPASYFNTNNANNDRYLDLIMMTNGWSRYDNRKVLSDSYILPETGKERSQVITGVIKGGLLNRPQSDSPVNLLITGKAFFLDTISNKEGLFTFKDFELPEYTQYVIQGKKSVELELFEEQFPSISPIYSNSKNTILRAVEEKKEDVVTKFALENRIIDLGEVTVTAKRKKINRYTLNSDLTTKLTSKDIEKFQSSDMYKLLHTIPHVHVLGQDVMVGPTAMFNSNSSQPPLILIENIEMQPVDLVDYSPKQVEEIEVLYTASETAIFGPRGNNGVILIYMKEGSNFAREKRFHIKVTTPLGYQVTKEFYSPKYETKESIDNKVSDLRSTVHWNPQVVTEKNGKANIEFYTSDNPNNYIIVIEGTASDGSIVRKVEKISIISL